VTDPTLPHLAADSIVHRFGTRTVLHAAYVDAIAGTVTALVGQSGAGKTTLLEILVGLRRPLSGQVRYAGARVPRVSRAALARRGVVYVPDAPWLSTRVRVRPQLALVARVWDSDADTVARASGVEPLLDRASAALSTGERRLCELAVATACRPDAIVLDEPFRDLDPLHRETMGRRLRALAGDGVAVLFADHDATMVAETADRLFAIEEGRTRVVSDFKERPIVEWYRGWSGIDQTGRRVDG
jgi:ABC-type multidrug transport system ATPase subunit